MHLAVANTTFVSIGCYRANLGQVTDVFNETLTAIQCANANTGCSTTCLGPADNSYYWVRHTTAMTVELCLRVCNSSGFRYAGIKVYSYNI